MLIFTDYTNKWKGRANESKKHMEEATALSLEEIKTEAKTLSFSPTKRSGKTELVRALAQYLFDDANADPSDVGEKCFDLMLKETRK